MSKKCSCGNLIPNSRLEILPNTKLCVSCSSKRKSFRLKGFIAASSKSDYSLCVIDSPDQIATWKEHNWRDSYSSSGRPRMPDTQKSFMPVKDYSNDLQ